MRHHFATPALLALFCATAACGQLEGNTDDYPVIATIRGQLSNPEGYAASSNMRVAIVWGAETGDVRVSQDVPVQPVFPSQFRLELRQLPPSGAMRVPEDVRSDSQDANCSAGWDPSSGKPQPGPGTLCDDGPPNVGGSPSPTPVPPAPVRLQSDDWRLAKPSDPFKVAVGTLVAYEDLNGNGQLDLLDQAATVAIDRVVGVNKDLYVLYAEGTATQPEMVKLGVKSGFSLLQIPDCVGEATDVGGTPTDKPNTLADAGPATVTPEDTVDTMCTADPKILGIDTLFTLPLTASPKLSEFMCKGEGSISGLTGTGGGSAPKVSGVAPSPETSYPLPSDPSLYCRRDGSSYTYTKCETAKLCGDSVCESAIVTRPTAPTASWPCPTE